MFLGFLARVAVLALAQAGQVAALMIGLSSPLQTDAVFGGQATATGRLFGLLAAVLVFNSGLYALPLGALAESYAVLPPGEGLPLDKGAEAVAGAVAASVGLALRLAAPLVLGAMLAQVAMGLVARLAPNLQVYAVAGAGQILAGLLLLALVLPALLPVWAASVQDGLPAPHGVPLSHGGWRRRGADAEDRTEAPTPKRIERARSEGQVPLSRDAVGLATLLGATIVGALALPAMGAEWLRAIRLALSAGAASSDAIGVQSLAVLQAGLLTVLPILATVAVAAVAATMGQTRGLVHGKALAPSLSRINPLSGLKRLLSVKGLAEVLRGVAKMVFVGAVVWRGLDLDALQAALHRPAGGLLQDFGAALLRLLLYASAAVAVLAAADMAWVRWQHWRQLRMSREDLRQETRESEGDPHVKGRLRRLRESRARRRMLAAIPKAAVVVTNPTHYAVALAYEQGQAGAAEDRGQGRGRDGGPHPRGGGRARRADRPRPAARPCPVAAGGGHRDSGGALAGGGGDHRLCVAPASAAAGRSGRVARVS